MCTSCRDEWQRSRRHWQRRCTVRQPRPRATSVARAACGIIITIIHVVRGHQGGVSAHVSAVHGCGARGHLLPRADAGAWADGLQL